MKNFVVLLSAGSSTRFGGTTKKQFYKIDGKPVLYYSLSAFNNSNKIDEIIIVSSKEDIEIINELVKHYNFKKVTKIVEGGSVRQQSVKNGLDAILEKEGNVLIHDSARPLVDDEIINELITKLNKYDGASPVLKISDTIVKVANDEISGYGDRNELCLIQTPQAFRLEVIKEAHERFLGKNFTDDTQLVKALGKKVAIIEGKEKLKKITRLEDTHVIETYIKDYEHLQN